MRLKTPHFWNRKDTLSAQCLRPFAWLYHKGAQWHMRKKAAPYQAAMPVLCIGNITAGGAGKTPAAIAIMNLVKEQALAENPCFLTRGYGGREKGPLLAGAEHRADDIGDEPHLLRQVAPAVVSRNRAAGARFAEKQGFDLIVMDDGFQNSGLYKDISLLVIDGSYGLGNNYMLPAGPLRELPETAYSRADAFIITVPDTRDIEDSLPQNKQAYRLRIQPDRHWRPDTHSRYIAFCGIGRPEKFRATLEQTGMRVAAWKTFPDHHKFSSRDLFRLAQLAEEKKARLVTTEKDFVRLPRAFRKRHPVDSVPLEARFQDEDNLLSFLKRRLKSDEAAA